MRRYFTPSSLTFYRINTVRVRNDYERILRTVGENIRKIRRSRGMSQEDLAYSSDVDRTYLGYIENAKHNVSLQKLCEIANALDVDVDDLLTSSD